MEMKGKRNGLVRALFAGLLLAASITGRAESIGGGEPQPLMALDLSLQDSEQGWRSDNGLAEFALVNEALDSSDAPATSYVRPARRFRTICTSCEFHVGVGGTYHSFENTEGLVIP